METCISLLFHDAPGVAVTIHAAVYRVLDELQGLGLVARSIDAKEVSRFEIADPEAHHHLIDDATGAVEPFEDAVLEQAIETAALRAGIELTGHEILLRGRRRPAGGA